MRLTPEQVGAVWILAGGPREVTDDAIAEAYVESGHDTDAVSSVGATGLWQIHPGGTQYKDPFTNAKAAVAKFRDGGNSFTKHWHNWQSAGTAAKRAAYMPRARRAASRVAQMNEEQLRRVVRGIEVPAGLTIPSVPVNPFDWFDGDDGGGGPSLPDLGNPLGPIAEFIGNIAEIWRGFFEIWLAAWRKIVDPETWKDLGKIIIGFILLTIGIRRLFTIST